MKKIVLAAFAVSFYAGISFGQNAVTSGTATTSGTSKNNKTDEDLVVITVNKSAQVETKVGSAFSKISANEIEHSQQVDLQQTLNTTPGILASDTGAPGGFAEVRIRGNGPTQSLILVDGIRVNTGINKDATPFLTNAGTDNIGSLEIVRGPQSTLYGSDSIGGVISLETKRGEGTPGVNLYNEIGSFSTFREGIGSSGAFGKLNYSTGYERVDSQNNRLNNDLSINRYSLRLDYQVLDNLSFQLNFRGTDGISQYPGSIHSQDYENNNPGEYQTNESQVLSLITTWKTMDQWTQKLTLGAYFERYTYVDPAYVGNGSTASNWITNAANYSADWQNIVQISKRNRATVGFAFNDSTGDQYYWDTYSGPSVFPNKSMTSEATYLQDEWEVLKILNLTGGLRYDHYQQAGSALTYRFTGAYLFEKTDTKIRSSYGTAFQAPTLPQLYSNNPWAIGNIGLKPQTSQGWDAGIDQYLLNRRVTLGATYFQNHIDNLITVPAFQYQNISSPTQNDGVELSAQTTLFNEWKTRLSYTWTESTVITTFPQPRNMVSLDTNYLLFGKWRIGCGASFKSGIKGKEYMSDWSVRTVTMNDYCTARIYSRYELNDHLAVSLRAENITNTRYETLPGYPALPFGVYGGCEVKF